MDTVVINTRQKIAERNAQEVLATRTMIAMLAATHMREMISEGWHMQDDGHGSRILVPPCVR